MLWDGSPEAARAVALHERVICCADRVIIAQILIELILKQEWSEDTGIVRQWLEVRNIPTTVREFSGGIADGLLKLARRRGSRNIGSWCFWTFSREEMIFGGVSRTLYAQIMDQRWLLPTRRLHTEKNSI